MDAMSKGFAVVLISFFLLFCQQGRCLKPAGVKASDDYRVHNLNTGLIYATIQEAISAPETVSGHTISVGAGTFFEHLTITKSISLVGEDRNSTIIDGDETGTVIGIDVSYVNIFNLTVRNPGRTWREQPWYIEGCLQGSNVVNVTVRNVACVGGAASLWFDHSTYVDVSESVVSDGEYLGIGGYDLQESAIHDNVVFNYGSDGIHLDGGSRNCRVVNNTVSGGFDGISLETNAYSSRPTSDNLIDGNSIMNITVANIGLFNCGRNTFKRNNMTGKQNTLAIWGDSPDAFVQDIDSSNTANNRVLYYLTNQGDISIDPFICPNAGDITLVECSNVTVRDFDLTSCMDGVLLAGSTGCTLMNVTIGNNREPIVYQGVPFISGGVTVFESNNNTIVESRIHDNSYGVCLYHSDGNVFYHNAFINIDRSVVSDYTSIFRNASSGYVSKSSWDNGLEGNYWSDCNVSDENHDGIGDIAYTIDPDNVDHYPLMGEFRKFAVSVSASGLQFVQVISNSTVTDLGLLTWLSSPYDGLQPGQQFIRFFVSGEDGSVGFCRLMIPRAVLNSSSYTVLVDSQPADATVLPVSNSTHAYLYLAYNHSAHEVVVTVPELRLHGLALFAATVLLAIVVRRRKTLQIV